MKLEIQEHLRRSGELISAAETLIKGEHWADAVSRSYYEIWT